MLTTLTRSRFRSVCFLVGIIGLLGGCATNELPRDESAVWIPAASARIVSIDDHARYAIAPAESTQVFIVTRPGVIDEHWLVELPLYPTGSDVFEIDAEPEPGSACAYLFEVDPLGGSLVEVAAGGREGRGMFVVSELGEFPTRATRVSGAIRIESITEDALTAIVDLRSPSERVAAGGDRVLSRLNGRYVLVRRETPVITSAPVDTRSGLPHLTERDRLLRHPRYDPLNSFLKPYRDPPRDDFR